MAAEHPPRTLYPVPKSSAFILTACTGLPTPPYPPLRTFTYSLAPPPPPLHYVTLGIGLGGWGWEAYSKLGMGVEGWEGGWSADYDSGGTLFNHSLSHADSEQERDEYFSLIDPHSGAEYWMYHSQRLVLFCGME